MKVSREIGIADQIEAMIKKEFFKGSRYEIRRDGHLIPKDRGMERKELPLCIKEGPTKTARIIDKVDALVLDTETNTVKLLIEYEQDTNPKNIIGNFLAPFLADHYESNFSKDEGQTYDLIRADTSLILITVLNRPRKPNNREQAPLQKGDALKNKLADIEKKLKDGSKIKKADIIIADTLDEAEKKTRELLHKYFK